ncbi:Uncharacterized protein FKW44_006060 [Caligus rogercresseyi]|uniref:Uncharacterized protein n=1 Tax=Caligus rogercresseyi TaxID=217165 RepID=A0A7T8KCU1_CALRO|nr:Uncharacterized protein FKW44_006060 [Caligus rogercresseyi]
MKAAYFHYFGSKGGGLRKDLGTTHQLHKLPHRLDSVVGWQAREHAICGAHDMT